MKRTLLALIVGSTLATFGCGSDSTEGLHNKDAATNKDGPPAGSEVQALADAKDLPTSSPEAMADLPAQKETAVAYDGAQLDVAAGDAAADARGGVDVAAMDGTTVDQGAALDGARPSLDAEGVDLSTLPAMTSFACRNDGDCCIAIDGCMNKAYLYSKGPGASPPPTIPPSGGTCTPCIPPAIQVACVAGQCVGSKVSGDSNSLLTDHCGHVSLADAGAHAPLKLDAGAPTTKAVWSCGE